MCTTLFSQTVFRPLTAVSIEEYMMKFNGPLLAQVLSEALFQILYS